MHANIIIMHVSGENLPISIIVTMRCCTLHFISFIHPWYLPGLVCEQQTTLMCLQEFSCRDNLYYQLFGIV